MIPTVVKATNWEAQVLRVVLFPQRALPLSVDLFTALAGAAPDTQEDRPKEGVRRQTGTVDEGHQLQVVVTPIRVEIIKSVVQKDSELLGGMQMAMGSFIDQLDIFTQMVRRWLPNADMPIVRVGVAATALAEASSALGAYDILKDNLRSVQIAPDKMRDLIYRVNWRAATAHLTEGFLNRLTTWSAVNVRLDAAAPGGPELRFEDRHFAQLELDVNTPAEHADPLPKAELVPIFDEIVQLVRENIGVGEVQ